MEDNKKVVLITGGIRGIGKEISRVFSNGNYILCLNYSSNKSKELAEELVLELKGRNIDVSLYECDISDSSSVNEMIKNIIDKYNKIDVLVNNAGITMDGLSFRMSDEQFNKVLGVNLNGTFYTIRAVLPHMIKQRGGNIINMTSIVGLHGNPGQANYSASKAGIIGLTKSIAKEVAGKNILVNAVALGAINTDMFCSLNDKIKESIINVIPLKRPGEAREVASTVFFLSEQTYITGQVIQVDGGMGI